MMEIKEKANVLIIYEKRLTIHWNDKNNQNVARIHNYCGVEISKPFYFENTKNGYKSLLRWVKTISRTTNKATYLAV